MMCTQRFKSWMTLLLVLVLGINVSSCSSDDDNNQMYVEISADNFDAVVVQNDRGVTTESYFASLNNKLHECSGYYDNSDEGIRNIQLKVDKAIEAFEQNEMQNVYYYGRYLVNYKVRGSANKVVLHEYPNKTLNKETLTKALTQIAADNPDGFTVNVNTLEPVTKGYAVSLEATQNSFGTEGLAKVIEYVTSHDVVSAYGGWLNSENNQYYYDATMVCNTREEAEVIARANHQIAYFDLENMEEIRL